MDHCTDHRKSIKFTKKLFLSHSIQYNHFNKNSININDPNDWPSLGEATVASEPATNKPRTNGLNSGLANGDTNGTVFKNNNNSSRNKKIVQTKNTSTPNGDMVETTVIEETDTFSKLVISKEPSNKDSNNNKVNSNCASSLNDNESTTETSSSIGNLDDSLDNDEKENGSTKCDSSTTGSVSKTADQSTDAEQTGEQLDANKSKKKNSKSKWKVLNIEQPSRPLMDKRRFERNHRERDHFRDSYRDRDSRMSGGAGVGRRKEYNNSNGKYGESNGGYYGSRGGGKYSNSNYTHNSHRTDSPNHTTSSSNHSKDSQTVNTNGISANNTNTPTTTTTNNKSNNNEQKTDKSTSNVNTSTPTPQSSTTSTTTNTTHSTTNQQLPNKSSSSMHNGYSSGYHRQKRLSGGGRMYRNNRSTSGSYKHRNDRMHYDSGNVTPLSDYDCNGYYMDATHHAPHHQMNGSNNSLSQNSYVTSAYYIQYQAPISRTNKWPYLDDSLRNQIEYYFSEENLQRDFFLRRKMDKEGYLPISLIASFHRVQALTLNVKDIIESLKKSEKIELSEDNKKVRPKNEPAKWPIMDQMFNLNNNMFEFGKYNNSLSCEGKDGSSTDSANDSRTSGVSLGSTDLHPNVPDFIPGRSFTLWIIIT